jgi:DNA-directed RNA polymerase subunit RPC12/RpoP
MTEKVFRVGPETWREPIPIGERNAARRKGTFLCFECGVEAWEVVRENPDGTRELRCQKCGRLRTRRT